MVKDDNVVLSCMVSKSFAEAVIEKQIAGKYHNLSDALRNFIRIGAGIEIDGDVDDEK